MAKRESQGLQIALIVFVVITILFMVTTVLFWKKYDNSAAEAADLQSRYDSAVSERASASDENDNLKRLLGHAEDAAWSQIETDYQQDMQTYGQGLSEQDLQSLNYRNLPERLRNSLQQKNKSLADALEKTRLLEQQKASLEADHKAKLTKAQEDFQAALATKDQALQLKNQTYQQLQEKWDAAEATYTAAEADKDGKIAQLEGEVRSKDDQLRKLNAQNDQLREQIAQYQTETLDVPDGEIIGVNQRRRSVWINLGFADAVREQMTFGVFDAGEMSLKDPEVKGRIEVVRVVSAHESEATIREDQVANPILRRDVIHSHVWQPGSPLRFALAGFMDANGDGKDDRKLLRRLIEINGGAIDAELNDKGELDGAITVHTRYLVVGDVPTEEGAAKTGFDTIYNQADTLGVQVISFTDVLGWVGYDRSDRTVGLGRSASAVDFQPKPEKGVVRRSTGAVSELYREQKPPFRNLRRSTPR